MTQQRKSNVRWNSEERARICDHLVGKSVTYWDNDFVQCIRSAQDLLFKPERRKVIKGRDNLPGIEDGMKEAGKRLDNKSREREQAEEAERQAQEEADRAQAMLAIQRSHPLDKAMETLAQEMVSRFFYHLRLAFDEESRAMFEDMGQAVPAFKHVAAARRRKVIVLGLAPREQSEIVTEFGNDFDLKFVEFGNHHSNIKDRVGHAEAVIAMTDLVGHHHTNQVKRHPGYIPVAGTARNLRNTLNALRERK